MNSKQKQYGLLVPNKESVEKTVKKVFDESSDSENEKEEGITDWIQTSLQAKKKQSRMDIQKVLKEDPTIYQYDELYDDMQKRRSETETKKKAERKPKYIAALLAQAEKRKKENERRMERQIQKERDAEGDKFADKESFVTPSYQKKLEEMKKMEEEEIRLAMLEDIGDVTKQKDMSGFYRHLYRTVTTDESVANADQKVSAEMSTKHTSRPSESTDKKRNKPSSQNDKKAVKKRQYRKRGSSSDSEDSSSKEQKLKPMPKVPGNREMGITSPKTENPDADTSMSSDSENETAEETNIVADLSVVEIPEMKKISIWEKRTVGEVFEQAVQRYLHRKIARQNNIEV